MNKIYYSIAITVMTGISFLSAQTNPTPWNLNSAGNYSFTSFSPTASSFPSGMVIHEMGASPTVLSTAASANIPLPAAQVQDNYTNVWASNAKGITIRSNPVAATTGYTQGQSAEVIVAVNTTSRNTVKISFKAGTAGAGSAQSATFKLRCQYRVGNSGSWLEMPGGPVEYQTLNVLDSVNMGPYTLPSSANNQSVVQVRWIYYYVSGAWSSQNNRSPRVQIDDISITSLPTVSQSAFSSVCESASAFTLTGGSPSGGTYSGTGVVGGTTFNPAIAGAGTYTLTYTYTDASGISNSASQSITVMAKPNITAGASANPICLGTSTALTASGASTYTWTGGVTNGTSFSPTSTSTYTVTGTNSNGCTNSTAVTVTVNPKPTVTANASSNPVCSGNTTALSGGGASTYTWTGGVTNGVAFSPASTLSYTVTGTDNNGCSNSSAITVTVNSLPTITANASANPICSGSSTSLQGNGASTYTWSGSVTDGVAFSPSSSDSYTVSGTDANGCTNATAITVTVNATPTVNVNGATTINSGSSTTLTATDATTYGWAPPTGLDVTSGSVVVASPSVSTTYTLTGTSGSCSGTQIFTVTVVMGPTNLQPAYCGITETALTQALWCVAVSGATNYRFEITDQSNNNVYTYTNNNSNTWFQLNWITAVGYAKTYGIRVAAYIAGSWSLYGTSCNVTTPAAPTTNLQPASCGITETSLTQALSCVAVTGATNYRFEVTDQSNSNVYTYTNNNTNTWFQLNWITAVGYAKTYGIRASAYVGGVWTSYGSSCNVTTPAAPTTNLQPAYCGITETSLTQALYCVAVTGATNYRFEVTDQGNSNVYTYTNNNTNTWFQMNWITSVGYAKTYGIRASAYVGGAWTSYGGSCNVTTPAAPTTNLQPAYCGITETALTQALWCVAVTGATNYQYEVTDQSNNAVYTYASGNSQTYFQMNWVAGVQYSRQYSVRVAPYVGGTWLAYGSACMVTTGGAATMFNAGDVALIEDATTERAMAAETGLSLNVYPNPNNGHVYLNVNKDMKVSVTNLLGEKVYEGEVKNGVNEMYFLDAKPGMYIIRVSDGENATQVRMIKN